MTKPGATARCHFCKKNATTEYFCFGCKHFVCERCEKHHNLMGEHDVKEHLKEDETLL